MIAFGAPVEFGALPPDAARDDLLLSRLTEDLGSIGRLGWILGTSEKLPNVKSLP
jgi:hypothetical protein